MSAEQSPQLPIYAPSPAGALRQGEIVAHITQPRIRQDTLFSREPVIVYEQHPYSIVVTQDCDLDQDHKARQGQVNPDKALPNILFCQMITAQELRGRQEINSTIWTQVKINKHERYHFFQKIAVEQDALQEGLPELSVDFKRYFTLPTDEVYQRLQSEAQRRCRLVSPYLEHFSARFAYYQFRVALPQEHFSE